MKEAQLSLGCSEILDQIERNFDSLLAEYGFEALHQQDALIGGKCLFVFESGDCRLRVIYDRGAIEVYLGDNEAEPRWAGGKQDVEEWFALDFVIEFLSARIKRSHQELRELESRIWSMSPEKQLADACDQLQRYANDAFALFRKDAPAVETSAFERYLLSPRPS